MLEGDGACFAEAGSLALQSSSENKAGADGKGKVFGFGGHRRSLARRGSSKNISQTP